MDSIDYFNDIAQQWNHIRTVYFKEDIRPCLHQHLDFSGKIVADIGCGTGFIALEAAQSARYVLALDQSTNMLKELAKRQIANIIPLQSSLDQLVLTDESVDIVTINMALHHAENPLQTIQEALRVLVPGGQLMISDPMEHQAQWAREEMHDRWLGFKLSEIADWLKQAGFDSWQVFDTKLKATATSSKQEVLETNIFMAVATKGEKNHEI